MNTAYERTERATMNRTKGALGTLNPQSPIPLYRQLADLLASGIRGGTYPAASRIPSENLLSTTYGIGRPTVRQATDYLIRKGMLIRKRGSGTYVKEGSNEVGLFSLGGTLSAFQREGIDISTRIHCPVRNILPDEGTDNPFSGKSAFFISRISYVESAPVLLEEMYFSTMLFPGLDGVDFTDKSISRVVEDVYYLKPAGGKQTFRVILPGSDRGDLLGISNKTPVLLVKRFLDFPRMENGIYAELFCLTDRFAFSQTLGGHE